MQAQTYAVVVYLHGPLAQFVNSLRQELNREHAGKVSHISVLPPRPLVISEEVALHQAREQVADWEPFEIEVIGVETFVPANGVVYLSLGWGADPMRVLHRTLNQGQLFREEPLGYVPHITIAQDMSERKTLEVYERVQRALAEYTGPRRVLVETLTFVRQTADGNWLDLAEVQLGRAPVLASS